MKPNKVRISLWHAYAYVIFWSLTGVGCFGVAGLEDGDAAVALRSGLGGFQTSGETPETQIPWTLVLDSYEQLTVRV